MHLSMRPRLLCDLGGVVGRANMLHPGAALSGNHKAAREQKVSRLLAHRIALTREQGFVDLRLPFQEDGICANLAPAFQQQNIIQHQLLYGDGHRLSPSYHLRLWQGEQRELVHQLFGLDFLENPDGRIQKDDGHKKQIRPGLHGCQRQSDEQIKQVKKRADIILYNLARGARDGLRGGILQARLFLGKHLLF